MTVRLGNVLNTSRRHAKKKFNLMIRLQNVLNMSWRHFCKTSFRRFKNILKTSWQGVLKTYGQGEYIGPDQDVLKTSSEDIWLRQIYSSLSKRLEDILETSYECKEEQRLQDDFQRNWWFLRSWGVIRITNLKGFGDFSSSIIKHCFVRYQ